MKKNKKIKKIGSILLIVFLTSIIYYNSSYYIKKNTWKSFSDVCVCDFMQFEEDPQSDIYLDWPKVYVGGEHVGYVIFCYYQYLYIYKTSETHWARDFGTKTGLGLCEYVSI